MLWIWAGKASLYLNGKLLSDELPYWTQAETEEESEKIEGIKGDEKLDGERFVKNLLQYIPEQDRARFSVYNTWSPDMLGNDAENNLRTALEKWIPGCYHHLREEHERRFLAQGVVKQLLTHENSAPQMEQYSQVKTCAVGGSKTHVCVFGRRVVDEDGLTQDQRARYNANVTQVNPRSDKSVNIYRFARKLDRRFEKVKTTHVHDGLTLKEAREKIVEVTLENKDALRNHIEEQLKLHRGFFEKQDESHHWADLLDNYFKKHAVAAGRRRLTSTPFGQLRRLLRL